LKFKKIIVLKCYKIELNYRNAIDVLTKVKEINEDYLKKKCVKFVPASGAATRMFSDLYELQLCFW